MTLALGSLVGVLIGSVTFGFAGFAFALFASAALALSAPPSVVIPAVMLLADTLALLLLWEHRGHLRRDVLRQSPPLAPGSALLVAAGVVAGAFLLGRASPAVGRLALAAVIVGFLGVQTWRALARAPARPPAPGGGAVRAAALGAGFLDGWISTGGVVIAVYLTWRRFAPEAFITAILVYFLVTDAMRVASYAVFGYWTGATLALYLHVLPVALCGYAGGVLLRRFVLPTGAFRVIVLTLLAVYAAALVLRAVSP